MIVFSIFSTSAALIYITRVEPPAFYGCPESCLGVVKIEKPNEIETVNLKTGMHREWRFCAKPPVQKGVIFEGYVIEVRVRQGIGCQFLDEPSADLPIHIVRGKDRVKPSYVPVVNVTYNDGPDRPILAHNCHNINNDSDVACDGEPNFLQELSYAKPAR